MKTILLLLAAIFFSLSSLQAQSETETLEWLKVKRNELSYLGCLSNTIKFGHATKVLDLTSSYIKLSQSNGAWTSGEWSSIKEIKNDGLGFSIIFNFTIESKPAFIQLWFNNETVAKKYEKAIRHMATLKGAKLIDGDLF